MTMHDVTDTKSNKKNTKNRKEGNNMRGNIMLSAVNHSLNDKK